MTPLRTLEFDAPSNSYLIRDTEAALHACLHTQEAVEVTGETARDAAEGYLRTRGDKGSHRERGPDAWRKTRPGGSGYECPHGDFARDSQCTNHRTLRTNRALAVPRLWIP